MKFALFALYILSATYLIGAQKKNRETDVVFQWNLLEFGFPQPRDRQQALANGNLDPNNAIPIDVAPHYSSGKSRIFITIPRFQTGIPYTLATVVQDRKETLLQAYPSYDWHNSHGSNCDGITSAFRVAITECNQMWVIDSGQIGSVQHCPPQLLLFDLGTDQLVHRYRFNATIYTPIASLFITPVVDVRDPPPSGRCRRQMIYVADVNSHGLVVYDYQQNDAWRVENRFMYPDPNYGSHQIAGDSFILMDGIFGLSLDKQNLYFHPLASDSEYAMSLSVLDNRANWVGNMEAMPAQFRKLGSRGSECAAEAMDSRSNLFCVTFNPIKLVSWNVNTPFIAKNLREIEANRQVLEFVSGMKVTKNAKGEEELWMLSNRFQTFAAGTQKTNEVNFRIIKRSIDDLQNGIDYGAPNKDLHHKLIFN